jgi:hypothetical protein
MYLNQMNSKNNEDLKPDSVYIDFETVFLN